MIERDQLRVALAHYLRDASDTLKAVFDLAMRQRRVRRFDNTRLILRVLTQLGNAGGSHGEILKDLRKQEPQYPAGNATNYLRELQSAARGEILRFDPVSGKYFFRDPLYLAYAQCLFIPPKGPTGKAVVRLFDMPFAIDEELSSLAARLNEIRQHIERVRLTSRSSGRGKPRR